MSRKPARERRDTPLSSCEVCGATTPTGRHWSLGLTINTTEQLTLKVASVIGRSFPLRTLVDVHPMRDDLARVPGQLRALEGLGLVGLDLAIERAFQVVRHGV